MEILSGLTDKYLFIVAPWLPLRRGTQGVGLWKALMFVIYFSEHLSHLIMSMYNFIF